MIKTTLFNVCSGNKGWCDQVVGTYGKNGYRKTSQKNKVSLYKSENRFWDRLNI